MINLVEDRKSKLWTSFVICLLFVSFYYLSYRYPFQINSSQTSPTYKDTPFLLQSGKYALFIVALYFLTLISLASKFKIKSIRRSELLNLTAYLFIFTIPLVSTVLTGEVYLFQSGLFFCALLPLFFIAKGNLSLDKLTKSIKWFLYISLFVEMIQIALYFFKERLPALAYRGSFVSVRFGSVWDDPNAFAFVISLLIPFVLSSKYGRFKKMFLTLSLLSMLLLTQSMTGIFATLISFPTGLFIIFIGKKERSYLIRLFWLMMLYLLIAFAVYLYLPTGYLEYYWYLKRQSVSEHLSIINQLLSADASQLIGFSPFGSYGESGYINLILNFGIGYFIVYVVVGFSAVIRLLKTIKRNPKGIEVYYGSLFFVLAYLIGMSNLPLDTGFPLNLIYVVCIIISYAKCQTSDNVKQLNA